jgi:glycosyltransferase involved in cell wall biosynthesis
MPDTQPLISIVVPAYNAERFLAATLQSIAAQTESRWECVVVDDGSSDATAAIAERFAAADDRFRVCRRPNGGASAARNTGFRSTSPGTSYVTFMDADDVWLPHALATLLARLQDRPDAIGSHGLAEFVDSSGALVRPGEYAAIGRRRLARAGGRLVALARDRPTDFDVLINGNVLFPPGLLLARRATYEAVGPFDESLNGPEDWDMLIRLSRHGQIEFVDEVLLHYRRHDSNLGAAAGIAEQAWRVRCKAFHSPENSPTQRRAAKLGWRAYQVHLATAAWASVGSSLRAREVGAAAGALAKLGAYAVRYARGWPSPRVTSVPERW